VFAVLGNNDWQNAGAEMAGALREAGIPVLENDVVDAGPLHVAGLADLRTREPDVAGTLAHVPEGAPVIVLSHDPDLFPQISGRVALTLSGHTHGGQIAIPRMRRRAIPSRFGERFARGHIVEGGRHLYVTSGVGTSGWPVRLLAPAEIVILRLRPAT
jgi:predicted MPP superfamily phosphohydrolase